VANGCGNRIRFRVAERRQPRFGRTSKIYANGGYRSELVENVKNKLIYDMEITLRTDGYTFQTITKIPNCRADICMVERFPRTGQRLWKDHDLPSRVSIPTRLPKPKDFKVDITFITTVNVRFVSGRPIDELKTEFRSITVYIYSILWHRYGWQQTYWGNSSCHCN
jgi:hypothetical protein